MKNNISTQNSNHSWDLIIKPNKGWIGFDFNELFRYRDLIYLFVKRDFVVFYKQTILGPLWYIIQPIINTLVFNLIFNKVAKLSTDGIPPFLFYMSGTVVWSYFAFCLNGASNVFVKNANIFGKVYFPRITVPISVILSGLFQFVIQFTMFLGFYFYFFINGANLNPNLMIITLPLIIIQMAILSLGLGSLISALTAKYRDLTFAMTFFVQIWMYLTPIVYPLSQVPEKYHFFYLFNPMTLVVELFRFAFLGTNSVSTQMIIINIVITILVFIFGLIMFGKTEKSFIDTV